MPSANRWFKVSDDINSDPQVWELREKFGDRAGFVWLEILSIANRNEGRLGPDSPQLRSVLASKCRVYSPKVRSILGWLLDKGWLQLDDGFRVAKYMKWYGSRKTMNSPIGNTRIPLQDKTRKDKTRQDSPYPLIGFGCV